MYVNKLQVENFRNLERLELEPHPILNLIHGDNGAGKTSIIEALVVLSRGRSFRSAQAKELIGEHSNAFRVFAETVLDGGKVNRLGIERSGKRWKARKNGADLSQISALTRSLPLVIIEPNSHLLVSGPPEHRRKMLDWGMFHVEHAFLKCWQRYMRSLKQRNAALRRRQTDVLDSLDAVLAENGEALGDYRKMHYQTLRERLQPMMESLGPVIGTVNLGYDQGWKGESLEEALKQGRQIDMERGVTGRGPHRCDMLLTRGKRSAKGMFSRGEQKIVSAALLLAQAITLKELGEKPLLLLDDLASELDEHHYRAVLDQSLSIAGQTWITGTRRVVPVEEHLMFHVERGKLAEVV